MNALGKQEGGDHYRTLEPQPATVLRAWNVNHLEGEAIYKILRHQHKNGREDILKAIHTLELILALDYGGSHDIKFYIDSLNRGWKDGQTAFKPGAVESAGA